MVMHAAILRIPARMESLSCLVPMLIFSPSCRGAGVPCQLPQVRNTRHTISKTVGRGPRMAASEKAHLASKGDSIFGDSIFGAPPAPDDRWPRVAVWSDICGVQGWMNDDIQAFWVIAPLTIRGIF